jgi:hypothetical protein
LPFPNTSIKRALLLLEEKHPIVEEEIILKKEKNLNVSKKR